ncbi:UNVERIFIED_CONTAM: hypothetical protein RMT77_001620 [Armadillidium vulgare]|nr:Battenin [Armadillidium vulgare]
MNESILNSTVTPNNSPKKQSTESSEEYESAEEEGNESRVLINRTPSEGSVSSYASAQREKWRNLIAYWFLGLTNNFGYVIMLSAAHDILSNDFENRTITVPHGTMAQGNWSHVQSPNGMKSNPRDCNLLSTGTVLLADIIPSLVIKVMAPFIPFFVHIRIGSCVFLSVLSLLLVGTAVSSSMALLGVVFASAASGIGETTFLAYSAYYHQDVVSTWSSGTGGAGVFGALSYAGLTSLGLTSRQSILFMLIVPLIMCISFWNVLEHPSHMRCCSSDYRLFTNQYNQVQEPFPVRVPINSPTLTFDEKLKMIPSLLRFMAPLASVYTAEYLINQGLSELLYFPSESSWISHEQQYRWYQVLYQVGVLISRSSVNLLYIEKIWITTVLQWINVVLFLTAAIYWWFGTIWLAFTLILWEGLLGGAAYVNTFYKLSKEVPPEEKEFAMQMTSMSDTFGITIAGFLAIPLHNAICKLPVYRI